MSGNSSFASIGSGLGWQLNNGGSGNLKHHRRGGNHTGQIYGQFNNNYNNRNAFPQRPNLPPPNFHKNEGF